MDLFPDLDKITLFDSYKLRSQLVDHIAKISDELSSLLNVKLAETSSVLHDLWLAWLRRSSITLDYLFVLHPQLKNLSVLFFNDLLLFAQILFHFVESMLCCRYNIFHTLLRGWSSVLTMLAAMID